MKKTLIELWQREVEAWRLWWREMRWHTHRLRPVFGDDLDHPDILH